MSLIPREGDASYVQHWINIDGHCPQGGQDCLVKCADGRRPKIIFTYDAEEQEFQRKILLTRNPQYRDGFRYAFPHRKQARGPEDPQQITEWFGAEWYQQGQLMRSSYRIEGGSNPSHSTSATDGTALNQYTLAARP